MLKLHAIYRRFKFLAHFVLFRSLASSSLQSFVSLIDVKSSSRDMMRRKKVHKFFRKFFSSALGEKLYKNWLMNGSCIHDFLARIVSWDSLCSFSRNEYKTKFRIRLQFHSFVLFVSSLALSAHLLPSSCCPSQTIESRRDGARRIRLARTNMPARHTEAKERGENWKKK